MPREQHADSTETIPDRRDRILDAAIEEFGAKGYAGARTAAIAERAGVNAQLITYYFGGKEGVLSALRERWQATQESLTDGSDFVTTVAAYAEAALANPSWARLLAWQTLEGYSAGGEQNERLREALSRTRERQLVGELRDDVDPELILVLAHALALAPILLPEVVAIITGEGKPWTAYRRLLSVQLPRLLEPQS